MDQNRKLVCTVTTIFFKPGRTVKQQCRSDVIYQNSSAVKGSLGLMLFSVFRFQVQRVGCNVRLCQVFGFDYYI